jgi:hypothetical protein
MNEPSVIPEEELEYLRTAIHDLNNRVGVVLATSELLQMGMTEGKPLTRSALIEKKALEARDILQKLAARYFD